MSSKVTVASLRALP